MTDLERVEEYHLPRFSWTYEHLPAAAHWYLLAIAYADSSVALFARMIAEKVDDSFHHAKVAAALLEHSIELFLKAVLVELGEAVRPSHASDQLLAQVRAIVPADAIQFSAKIDEAVRRQPDAPGNQFLRYPTDRRGEPWSGHTHIDLSVWFQQAKLLRADFERIRASVQRYGATRTASPPPADV